MSEPPSSPDAVAASSRPPEPVGEAVLPVELVRAVYRGRLLGEAAKIAYFFFLSLFPAILVLFALTGILGGDAAFAWIMGQLERVLPGSAARSLARFVLDVTGSSRPGMLSLSIALTMWSASSGFLALGDSLDTVFAAKRGRRWWKRRALALAFVAIESVALVAASILLLVGPELLAAAGLGTLWHVFRLPVTFVLAVLTVWRIYRTLPSHPRRPHKADLLAGATMATVAWAVTTWVFRFYLRRTTRYATTYGVVGGMIALLVWLQLTAVTLLLGGALASILGARRARREERRAAAGAALETL